MNSFSFASFNRYLEKSQVSKYAGLYKQEATTAVKEKALDNEISGSFSFKNVGASADLTNTLSLLSDENIDVLFIEGNWLCIG